MTPRTAIVTGAGRGIGAAIASALDAAGVRVALVARSVDQLETVAAGLANDPVIVPADLSTPDGPGAAVAHFAAVWGSAQVMLPALDVAPPPWKSEPGEIAIDAFHHAVYAAFTALAFAGLRRSSS